MTELFAHIPRRIHESYKKHETSRSNYKDGAKWSAVLTTIVTNIDYHYYTKDEDLSNLAVLTYFYQIYGSDLIKGVLTKAELKTIATQSNGNRNLENSILLAEVCKRVAINGADFTKLRSIYRIVKGVHIDNSDVLKGLIEDIMSQSDSIDVDYVTNALTWWYINKYSNDTDLRNLLDNIYSQKYDEFNNDKPRALTKHEIENIVEMLPVPKHSIRRLREHMHTERQNDLRRMLRLVKVSPSKIAELGKYITRDYENAQVAEYTAVGIAAAEAMGGPITQMALNSFHASGSLKSVTRGTEKFTEVFNASKTIRTPTMRIKFKNPLITFDEVIDKRREFVNVDVKSLIRNAQILPVNSETVSEREWWYTLFELYSEKEIPESTVFLRLTLDTVEMYSYGVSISSLEKMILETDPKLITVVSSPIQEGIMDIYIDQEEISSSNAVQEISIADSLREFVSDDEFILSTIVYPRIVGSRIGGIKQIVNLEHAKVGTVIKFILSETLINSDNGYYTYRIKVNDKLALLHGFDIVQLELALLAVGFDVTILKTNTRTNIEMDARSVVKNRSDKPSTVIGTAINENEADENLYENELKLKGVKTYRRRDPTLISILTDVYRADTLGINLAQVLKRSDIDANYTYCNDMHVILRYFGIGAAKSYIIQTINEALSGNDTYIDSRHYFLISDYMTSLGYITPINFAGSTKYSYNTLSLASQQSAYSVISNAAITGTKEYVTGYTDHIAYGQLMRHSLLGNPEVDYNTLPDMELDKINESFKGVSFNVVDYQSNITAGTYIADTLGVQSTDGSGMSAAAFKGQLTPTTVNDLFDPTVGHLIQTNQSTDTLDVYQLPDQKLSVGAKLKYDITKIKSRVVGFNESLITLDMVNPISYVIIKSTNIDTLYDDVDKW